MDLFSPTNKAGDQARAEGEVESPEYTSTLKDEDILQLTRTWTENYQNYVKDIEKQQKENERYWLGKQYSQLELGTDKRALVDNLIFEALETFLPIATRANPEPLVSADNTDEGNLLAKNIRAMLTFQADRQHLRMKLKKMTRHWALYYIGVAKIIWNVDTNDIETKIVLPTRMILDPHAEIEEGGEYTGEYLGEKKRLTAKKLKRMFPKSAKDIDIACGGQDSKRLDFVEWSTVADLFFTLGDNSVVLGKFKNIHWNYDGEVDEKDPETGEMRKVEVKGRNHFEKPRIPYIFLSVFNLGKQPHDENSLIYQNIPLQDNINKRYKQIDRNVDSQNNGIVLSGKSFTKEQASEATTQLSKGGALWVPDGDVNTAYKRDQAPMLAGDVFRSLEDARQELRNIFGTAGSSPQGIQEERSVRGKIMVSQADSSRIGGGITEYIEQVADSIYEWWVQMMYVHYTEPHYASAVGEAGANEIVTLRNIDITRQLTITVKEGSLIPKDPLIERNEAVDLWSAQALDPITLFTRLDFPNPYEAAKKLFLWKTQPQALFPDLMQPQPQGAPQPGSPVSAPAGASIQPNPKDTGTAGPATQAAEAIQARELLQGVPLPGGGQPVAGA